MALIILSGALLATAVGLHIAHRQTARFALPLVAIEENLLEARKININLATMSQLEGIPGVGTSLAARIVSHRASFGPFGTLTDIIEVKGVGPKKYSCIKRRKITRPFF